MAKTLLALLLFTSLGVQQSRSVTRPKLVVVISLDQFPYVYLTRFREYFGKGGFAYLLDRGANFSNATYKHALTSTGPGHAVISSGAYGNQNGIFANAWYDQDTKKDVYCVSDISSHLVGATGEGVSPANLIGTTVGDELKICGNFRPKVIALSHKDRAAILLGGKFADLALWMTDSLFVTSSYYCQHLPEWVQRFNRSGLVNSYFKKYWSRTMPDPAYAAVDNDDVLYEEGRNGLGRTFPHPIRGDDSLRISNSYYEALLTSPFGNEILAKLAKQAVVAEQLGNRGTTDLLCISFSSNDYVGHRFGPQSQEVFDMTIRTDGILMDLLKFLEKELGLNNCLIVLTSDHGVSPATGYLRAHLQTPGPPFLALPPLKDYCDSALTHAFGPLDQSQPWISRIIARNIYLNLLGLAKKKLSAEVVAEVLADSLLKRKEVVAAFPRRDMAALAPGSLLELRMKNSFSPQRSGDVVYSLAPFADEEGHMTGSQHGSPYECDAHVPLLLAGLGIRPGTYATDASPADIAPTLSLLCGTEFPSSRQGRVLLEALRLP
jgi:predicted AlkP superfamily pyrophosphatase or phosphodiesterase